MKTLAKGLLVLAAAYVGFLGAAYVLLVAMNVVGAAL